MERPNIHRLLELQALLLQFGSIGRRLVGIPPTFRPENDIEHSYNLAMVAWFLSSYFPELDSSRLMQLAMAHDLVEIYAGDTDFNAQTDVLSTKRAREAKALERLSQEWTDFPGLLQAIREYEARDTLEAKFVYALDKIMPLLVIYLGEGHNWKLEGTTFAELHNAKVDKVKYSKVVDDYYQELYQLFVEHQDYFAKA